MKLVLNIFKYCSGWPCHHTSQVQYTHTSLYSLDTFHGSWPQSEKPYKESIILIQIHTNSIGSVPNLLNMYSFRWHFD